MKNLCPTEGINIKIERQERRHATAQLQQAKDAYHETIDHADGPHEPRPFIAEFTRQRQRCHASGRGYPLASHSHSRKAAYPPRKNAG
jgi:hypothetical protein